MPFMIGPAPIRRTLKYLESGKLIFRDKIQIMSINYNSLGKHHAGARELVFWHLPQIQFKNPNVQIATFKNRTPTPFIRCYFDNGEDMLIDIDNKKKDDILDHLIKVVGKTKETLDNEQRMKQEIDNIANFGFGCSRHCICELPGQVPCPSLVILPKRLRGKYRYGRNVE